MAINCRRTCTASAEWNLESLRIHWPSNSVLKTLQNHSYLLSRSNFHGHTKELEPHTFQIWLFLTMGSGLLGKHPFFTASPICCFCSKVPGQCTRIPDTLLLINGAHHLFWVFVCDIITTSHFWGLRVSPFSWVKESQVYLLLHGLLAGGTCSDVISMCKCPCIQAM